MLHWRRDASSGSICSEMTITGQDSEYERPKVKLGVSAKFIRGTSPDFRNGGDVGLGKVEIARRTVAGCLQHTAFDISLGLIICLDVIFNVAEIDARAVGLPPPWWAEIGALTCLAAYTVEFLLQFFVSGWTLFRNPWAVVDFSIICSGMFEIILTACGLSAGSVALLRLLRLLRMLRLVKIFRQFRWLTELRKLMMMMASCLRTLFWSFLFCFIVMSAWSMAAVELINPMVQKMAADGAFADCQNCRSALTSVMRANLMMFQTIIAGDSWGKLAVPVIEAHPWTAIIFVGSLLTITFGVLNMIVAVVVDTFAEHRQKDVMNLAEELDADAEVDKRFLQKIFDQIDEDGSGDLSLDEVMLGARTVPEFQSRLRVMDIDENDLVQMFEMIDCDGSGSVDSEEFITALNRWAYDSKTAARFVKYQLMRSIAEQAEMRQLVVCKLDSLEKHIKKASKKRSKGGSRPTPEVDELTTGSTSVPVSVQGDVTASTLNFRSEAEDSIMVRPENSITAGAHETPLADEFHEGGSGDLAEGKNVEGSESEAPSSLEGARRSRRSKRLGSGGCGPDFFLGRQRQTGFYFSDEFGVRKWTGGTESILEPEPEQSLKTAIAIAVLVLKESLMAAAEEAMTESLLAAELPRKKAVLTSSGSSGSFEKMSLRQSVAAAAERCRSRALGAAPLDRAVPPLLGPRGPQATLAVRAYSGFSAPPSPPIACPVSELLGVQEDLPEDGPEQLPASRGIFIAEQL
ncbi:unnamed protein product [Polarella glacialis]|uniref:EF-hand domain-containing protein n=1 Tax=Polarella glacialis TaxID=89957 RepID=A0A813J9Y1_POLGL|nr:unnamed protein product [Polarella glacialis]